MGLTLLLYGGTPLHAQVVSPPEMLGVIAGPGAVLEPAGVRFYGTDLGWTFEHRGQHFMLFGDTWPHAHSPCEALPHNDDSQATLPLELPPSGLPTLTVATDPDAPDEFARIRLFRDGESLVMGYNKTPLTAFSDGTDAVALFGLVDLVRCTERRKRATCRPYKHLTCSQEVGVCTPPSLGFDAPCDTATGAGCIPGQQCEPTPSGVCVDPDSSQYDGTPASLPATAAYHTHVGIQDAERPTDYLDVGTIASNKFIDVTARAVRCFSGKTCGSDYAPGHGAVLVWGRPGYDVQEGRQAHMYLMAHPLPIRRNARGMAQLRPRYFAGVRQGSGEPIWTKHESRAQPLAMDGVGGGNPDDDHPNPNQTAISWLGPPIDKWMMLYGGGRSALSGGSGPDTTGGAIRARFADHPWGPWSPPIDHLAPGSPANVGDPFGPGGFMFNPECADQPPATCAPSDPTRPVDFVLPGCPPVGALVDTGILYAANIIDAYTRADGTGGLDVHWIVSAWNPYLVAMLRTNVKPGGAAAAAKCPSSAPAAATTNAAPFRWCASDG